MLLVIIGWILMPEWGATVAVLAKLRCDLITGTAVEKHGHLFEPCQLPLREMIN